MYQVFSLNSHIRTYIYIHTHTHTHILCLISDIVSSESFDCLFIHQSLKLISFKRIIRWTSDIIFFFSIFVFLRRTDIIFCIHSYVNFVIVQYLVYDYTKCEDRPSTIQFAFMRKDQHNLTLATTINGSDRVRLSLIVIIDLGVIWEL